MDTNADIVHLKCQQLEVFTEIVQVQSCNVNLIKLISLAMLAKLSQ